MPSLAHDAPLDLLRLEPTLLVTLLRDGLGVDVPAFTEARVEDADLTQLAPAEYRADLVVTLRGERGVVLAIVVEMQRAVDPRKKFMWPIYVAAVHARTEATTILVVLTDDERVADWARLPIATLPGGHVAPLVAGPGNVPKVVTVEEGARAPAVAILSAVVHRLGPDAHATAVAAILTVAHLADERWSIYADVLFALARDDVRLGLENPMNPQDYQYKTEFFRKFREEVMQERAAGKAEGKTEGKAEGKAQGKAEGKAEAILHVLAARRVDVPDEQRTRIAACTDEALLERWLARASVASSVEDVLGDE